MKKIKNNPEPKSVAKGIYNSIMKWVVYPIISTACITAYIKIMWLVAKFVWNII